MSNVNEHIEYEEPAGGMTVGRVGARFKCPCGFTTYFKQSGWRARKDAQLHANVCDEALKLFFPDESLDDEAK